MTEKAQKKHRIRNRLIITVCVLAFLFVLPLIVAEIVLTPTRCARWINQYAPRFLQADITLEKADISLLKSYPLVRLDLQNGCITNLGDTLLQFRKLSLGAHLPALFANHLFIKYVQSDSLKIDLHVHTDGRASWDVMRPDTNATRNKSSEFRLSVNNLHLPVGADIRYRDDTEDFSWRGIFQNLDIRRERDRPVYGLHTDSSLQSLRMGAQSYLDQAHFKASGGIGLGKTFTDNLASGAFSCLHFHNFNSRLKQVPLFLNGSLTFTPDSICTSLGADFPPTQVQNVLDLVPDGIIAEKDKIEAKLQAELHIRLDGAYRYQDHALPKICLVLSTTPGQIRYPGFSPQWHYVQTQLQAWYHPHSPDSCNIRLDTLYVKGSGLELSTKGLVSQYTTRPALHVVLNSTAHLDSLPKAFLLENGIRATGTVVANGAFAGRLDQLNPYDIGKTHINSLFRAKGLTLQIKEIGLSVNTTDTYAAAVTRPQDRQRNIRIDFRTDSLLLHYKTDIRIQASKTFLTVASATGAFNGDTARIHPVEGKVKSRYLNLMLQGTDTTNVRMAGLEGDLGMKPLNGHPSVPAFWVRLVCDRAGVRSPSSRFGSRNNHIALNADLEPKAYFRRRTRMARLDSLQQLYPHVKRDSLFLHDMRLARERGDTSRIFIPRREHSADEFAFADIDLQLPPSSRNYVNLLNLSGNVNADGIRLSTPAFPLPSAIDRLRLQLKRDTAVIHSLEAHAGTNRLLLTGKLSNIKAFLNHRGTLIAKINAEADTLDLDQCIGAWQAGNTFKATASAEEKKEITRQLLWAENDAALQEMMADRIAAEKEFENLLVIPGNVDLSLDASVRYGIFGNIHISDLLTRARCKNRVVQCDTLHAVTPVGVLDGALAYATPNPQSLRAGFDARLRGCRIEDAVRLIPALDSLLPMLKSMEGLLNLKVAATAQLDARMNVILPTTRAACRLEGSNLVLLDGKTFTKAVNLLQLGKKARNSIDHISVNLTVKDGKIQVYPFLLEWDKYQVAASGEHHLDRTFDYHISVIKSTMPFRVGLDIKGEEKNLQFHVGKAKYRNALLPSYIKLIDSQCLELNTLLRNIVNNPALL